MVVSDGAELIVLFWLYQMPYKVPMFQKLANSSIVSCIPADKPGDDGSQYSTSKSGWVKYLIVPLKIDNLVFQFILWFFDMC